MTIKSDALLAILIVMVAFGIAWPYIQPRIDCAMGVKSACAVLERASTPKGSPNDR